MFQIKAFLVFLLVLAFAPLTAQKQIELEVDYSKAYEINKDVYGCNNWLSVKPYYINDNSFIEKYNDLGKPTMRYPGGTGSNYLNLKTGFYKTWRGETEKDVSRVNSFNSGMIKSGKGKHGEEIGKFVDFLKRTDAKSTFVINLTSMTLDETASVLDSILNKGVKLDYVEMGNELYYGQYQAAIPDVFSYVALAKERALLVKARFPKAKIGVLIPSHLYTTESFLPGEGNSENRQELWYETLKNENFYDAIIIHLYSTVGMDSEVKSSDFLPYKTAYSHAISHADNRLRATLKKLNQDFLKKEIWVTEYHVGGFGGDVRAYRLRHSYLGGLYTSNFLLKLFENQQVTLSSWHSMAQWLTYESEKKPFDRNDKFDTKVNYHFFKLFKEPVLNASSFAKVSIIGTLNYSGIGGNVGNFNDLEAGVFFNENTGDGYFMLFNKWDNTYRINKLELEKKLAGNIMNCTEITPNKSMGILDALESEVEFTQTNITSTENQYTLEPFSVYLFEYKLKR